MTVHRTASGGSTVKAAPVDSDADLEADAHSVLEAVRSVEFGAWSDLEGGHRRRMSVDLRL